MKIVLVDDNESIRKVLRALCEAEGHEVVAEFGDGNGLQEYVATHHPDVVCLDHDLPGKNGLELLVGMNVTANHVDVVMITGVDDPELKGHAADLGAAGFIRKPFEQAQVVDELNEIAKTRGIVADAAATAPDMPQPTAPVTPSPEAAVDVIPRSAVIVDDSGSIRLLLKGILTGIGIRVVGIASNGHEGIELVKKTRPALVCLDVDMPGMTGLEALPQIRAANPLTKVVMITGNAGRTIVETAVAGGAKGYFLKPVRPVKVEEFLRKLLQL